MQATVTDCSDLPAVCLEKRKFLYQQIGCIMCREFVWNLFPRNRVGEGAVFAVSGFEACVIVVLVVAGSIVAAGE